MTQEEKELILKDLCARLTCRTMIKCNTDGRHEFDEELSAMHLINFYQFEILSYLRPMSSMTKEEEDEYKKLCRTQTITLPLERYTRWYDTWESIDWLNAHHFDYRRLIERGLALEAKEGIYDLHL